MSKSNKKVLGEKLKNLLNSPNYVAMPDLIKYDDRCGDILTWLWRKEKDGNIHKKENWISGKNINPNRINRKESENIIYYEELEPDDWEEIVSLIKKRNKEKEQIWEEKKKNIEAKLNSQTNLYYYWGSTWRKRERNENADVWVTDKGMRGFVTLLGGQGNGLTYHLYIAENHPVLNNFSFQTGFYSVETDKPIKKRVGRYNGYSSTGGESNPFNFTKFVETDDQITIAPYNESLEGENSTIKFLIQYFQESDIKSIKIENGKLSVTYNNNEVISQENITSKLQVVKDFFQKNNKKEVKLEELKSIINTNHYQVEKPKDNTLLIVCGISGILIIGVVIGLLINKKRHKNK